MWEIRCLFGVAWWGNSYGVVIKSRLLASNLSRCRIKHEDFGETRGPTRDACSLYVAVCILPFYTTCIRSSTPTMTHCNPMESAPAYSRYTTVYRLHASLVRPRFELLTHRVPLSLKGVDVLWQRS